ncbi:MAG: hypothetical protein JKY52_09580 [Flavobacteriales bacterium]|nr:hypothetical protein [Flavobacteriales bacterium]
MTTALLIWAYLTVVNIITFFTVVGLVVFFIVGIGVSVDSMVDGRLSPCIAEFKHKGKAMVCFLVFIFLASAVPSKYEIKLILGGTALVAMSQVDGVSELPENLVNAANSFLESVTEKEVTE